MNRTSDVYRDTQETKIKVSLNIDGEGKSNIETGMPFFDHMLTGFTKHGLFDLDVKCDGDIEVDGHHSVEDTGIVIGQAIKEAIGDKKGIVRFGYFILPMDDALVLCSIDLGGRPYFDSNDYMFPTEKVGELDTEVFKEFFAAVSYSAMMNIHIRVLAGDNSHHIAEAMFKAFAKSLDMATALDPRIKGVQSTKGIL